MLSFYMPKNLKALKRSVRVPWRKASKRRLCGAAIFKTDKNRA